MSPFAVVSETMIKYLLLIFLTARPAAAATAQEAFDLILANGPESKSGKSTEAAAVKAFTFTEDEVNDFIAQLIRQEAGKNKKVTVKSGSVSLKAEHIIMIDAVASFSAEAVKPLGGEEDSSIIRTVKRYLTLENAIHLECLVSSAKGNIFIRVLKAKVKGIQLPESFVQKIVKVLGASQRPPVDFSRLFPMPNGIQKIEILPQKLGLQVEAPPAPARAKNK